MKKIIEGNPALTDEHPHQLNKGALVYWLDRPEAIRAEIILSGLFSGEELTDMEVDWRRFTEAYQEVLELPQWTGNTPEGAKAIAEHFAGMVRRYVEFNSLYKIIRNKNVQIRFCTHRRNTHDLDVQASRGGIIRYPRPDWTIEMIPLGQLEYPNPENLYALTNTRDRRLATFKIANVTMTFEQQNTAPFETTTAWNVEFGAEVPSETDTLLLSHLETTRDQWRSILNGLEKDRTQLPLEVLIGDYRRVINAVLNRDESENKQEEV